MTIPGAAAAYIDSASGKMLEDLTHLVAIPTGGGLVSGLEECRGVLVERLRTLGGPETSVQLIPGDERPEWIDHRDRRPLATRDAPPATAVVRAAGTGGRVLLCGHVDTVHDPEGPFRRLEVDPSGEVARGPGAADMKGGILVAVVALEALAHAGVRGPWTFVLNSDEETGSYGSDRALRAVAAEVGIVAGLVFEPALPDGSLVVERPGSGQFVIDAVGKSAHVGRDIASGRNAITLLSRAVLEISAQSDAPAGKIVNVGVIRGGSATNIVPDAARAWGNVRFGTPRAERELSAALDALSRSGPEGELIVRRSFARPAKPRTPGVESLALLARRAAEELEQALPFGTTGGVCDGNNLQSSGIPVIDTLGVRGGGLHTTDEWIEVRSLAQRAKLTASLLVKIWSGDLGSGPRGANGRTPG